MIILFRNKIIRKRILIFLILLFIGFSLFAWSGDIWSINLESNLDFNLSNKFADWRLYDIEFIEGFNNRKPILELDFSLKKGFWFFITEGTVLSLRPSVLLDLDSFFSPMVKNSYLEYDNGFIYGSIGRRKQSMGVSDFNLFVNRDMPFYDGFNLSVGKKTGFRFDSLISVSNISKIYQSHSTPSFKNEDDSPSTSIESRYTNQYSKYFMYHALSYVGKSWFLMIGESAILANPKSIGDLNIFANIHNENSERANVGMEFQFAKTINSNFMFYSMLGIDDLPVLASHNTPENLTETPSAMAMGIGLKWQLKKGGLFSYPSHNFDKGIRHNIDFNIDKGGIIVELDYVATSRWFYIRPDAHKSSKNYFLGFQSFYNYFYNPQLSPNANHDHYSVPFGPKYGGDTQLIRAKISLEDYKYKFSGIFEIVLQGWEGRERSENKNYWGNAPLSADESDKYYSRNWLTSGDIKPLFIINLNYERGILPWLTIYSGVSLAVSTFAPTQYNCNLGFTIKM
jgi:hypothetical protein